MRGQGVSLHLTWLLQIVHHNQEGVVRGDSSTSRWFNIFWEVRQGCVLSPRLFRAVLQTVLSEWRQSVASFGLDFGDGLPELLDLGFAEDLPLFARSAQDAAKLLDDLVRCCSGVGLRLNVTKTKIVTSEAQAPAQSLTPAGSIVDILPPAASHKWLGCLLSSKSSRASSADVDFHLQAASRAFLANKQILLDGNVCLKQRLEFFDAVVTPVACFAAGHGAIFHADIRQFDVEFRKLLRRIVGPPADIQWDMPWHIIGYVCAARPGDKCVCALAGTLRCMLLIYQIPRGSSERWHGNQLGDLLWVDPAICGHLVSRHLLAGNDGTAGKQHL